jgi:peptidoglycan-associated lipoprotein
MKEAHSMRKSLYPLAVIVLLLAGIAVTGTGCAKKVAPPPPAAKKQQPEAEKPPTPPPPTITLTASPAAIEKGQSVTLSWRTTNATEVSIDGGIGTVEAAGSRTVQPSSSTTYRARANGPGGVADAEARITVNTDTGVVAPPARVLTDAEFFTDKIKDIYFDYDSYEIRVDQNDVMAQNVRAMAERRGIRITIEGHCDERGSEKYNIALGDKRAGAIKDFLVAHGIDPARIDTISYGEERPFAPGHDEDSWRQNRRGHFVMR